MSKIIDAFITAFLLAILILGPVPTFAAEGKLTIKEIEKLVTPISLYPDKLLQQVLPAATFPDQIADAALLIRTKEDAELIADQDWDVSVKNIAGYPGVLKMMYEKLDWTTDLGNAFLSQHEDVLDSIQTLRAKAKSVGNLESGDQQNVTQTQVDGQTVIVIEPADPEVIYVPQQTTEVVYSEYSGSSNDFWAPVATFGVGMALGYAMGDHDDDHYYYGGGYGGMWHDDDFDDWVDRRHDSIDHALDNRQERFEGRQDLAKDRQDHRQDRSGDRQEFRQDWARDNPDQVNRENLEKAGAQRKQQLDQARSGTTNTQRQQKVEQARAGTTSTQRTQQREQAKSALDSRSFSNTNEFRTNRATAASNNRATTWSTQGGSSYANRASNRGTTSRTSAKSYGGGSSYGGSRGGVSRSGGFSGGSRGGGGRSGGGGRGGRR